MGTVINATDKFKVIRSYVGQQESVTSYICTSKSDQVIRDPDKVEFTAPMTNPDYDKLAQNNQTSWIKQVLIDLASKGTDLPKNYSALISELDASISRELKAITKLEEVVTYLEKHVHGDWSIMSQSARYEDLCNRVAHSLNAINKIIDEYDKSIGFEGK